MKRPCRGTADWSAVSPQEFRDQSFGTNKNQPPCAGQTPTAATCQLRLERTNSRTGDLL